MSVRSNQKSQKPGKRLTRQQKEFLSTLHVHGTESFIESLKLIHDFALYHTDLCFDKKEKAALFYVKVLWEQLEELGE